MNEEDKDLLSNNGTSKKSKTKTTKKKLDTKPNGSVVAQSIKTAPIPVNKVRIFFSQIVKDDKNRIC